MNHRIETLPAHNYPWYARLIFFFQRRKYGAPLESAKMWARSPRLFLGVSHLYGALDRKDSPIDPVLRALITVRISQINHCPFCVDINSALVLERGGEQKLHDLGNFMHSSHFSNKEKCALRYAEVITRTDEKITDDLWSEMQTHFSEDEIVELTGLIAFQNLSSKFNEALDIKPQGFCKLELNPSGDK